MKKSRVFVAGVLMSAFWGLANASSGASDARQREVYFGDLDLHSRTGVATLYRRIEAAARGVCEMPNGRMLAVRVKVQACVQETTARAFTQVNTMPALSSLSQGLYIWASNRTE